jgi:tRNA threonylcarbamoyl adenosine modification protein YeaZ
VAEVLVLVLDSATPAITAAIASVGDDHAEVVAASVTVDARAHGERLAPQIRDVLARANARPHDLAGIVAGVGPGPFTGLRVGLVTAAAIGDTLGIPVYGVCTLDAFATADRILVATDARRKEIYWAGYAGAARICGPSVDKPAMVVPPPDVAYAVGDGALLYADVLGLPVREQPRFPPPAGLLAPALDRIRGKAPGETITPLYLRRPDAVEPAGRKPALAPNQ